MISEFFSDLSEFEQHLICSLELEETERIVEASDKFEGKITIIVTINGVEVDARRFIEKFYAIEEELVKRQAEQLVKAPLAKANWEAHELITDIAKLKAIITELGEKICQENNIQTYGAEEW